MGASASASKVAPAPDENIAQAIKQHNRNGNPINVLVRLATFTVVLAALYLIAQSSYAKYTETHAYHLGDGLTLEVSGCDIEFAPGASATVSLEATRQALSASRKGCPSCHVTASASDLSAVSFISVHTVDNSTGGCDVLPNRRCRPICLLRVSVPPAGSATTFTLMQLGADKNVPIVHVLPGTSFGTLRTQSKPPNLPVVVEEATIDVVSMNVGSGSLYSVRSTLGSVTYTSLAPNSGSVYLLGVPTGSDNVALNYRQPSNRVCLASTSTAWPRGRWKPAEPNNAFANCDVRALVDGTSQTENFFSMSVLRWLYDPDSNARVTMPEFTDGLQKLTCCGGNCPFSSWCEADAFRLGFGGQTGVFGNSLSVNQFAANLLATNMSQWFPRCTTPMHLRHGWDARTMRTLSPGLTSDGGEVFVVVSGGSVPPAALPPAGEMNTYTHDGKLEGFRLSEGDAKRLMSTYGKTYGDRDATGDSIIVFDVYLGGAHTIHSRWLYSTRAVYLAMSPASLSFLSLGLLLPTVIREKALFFDNDCTLIGPRVAYDKASLSAAEKEAVYARVQEQLARALKSSALDKGPARPGSALVRIGAPSDAGPITELSQCNKYLEYPTVTTSPEDLASPSPPASARYMSHEREWRDPRVHALVFPAMVFSVVIGVMLGVFLAVVLTYFMSRELRRTYERQISARTVVLRKQNMPKAGIMARDAIHEPSINPWVEPNKLIEILFVAPMRRRLNDPLHMFAEKSLVRGGASKTPDTFVYLRQVMQRFEFFCLARDLQGSQSREELQQRLLTMYDDPRYDGPPVRVKVVNTRRIQGLRFRTDADVKIPSLDLAADPRTSVKQNEVPSDLPKSLPPRSEMNKRSEAVSRILAVFLMERCLVAPPSLYFVDVETRAGQDGTERKGLKEELHLWCKTHGLEAPNLSSNGWRRVLPSGVKFQENFKARQVLGLAWKTDEDPAGWNVNVSPSRNESLPLLPTLSTRCHPNAPPTIPALIYYPIAVNTRLSDLNR